MTNTPFRRTRQVVPAWRPFDAALSLGDLAIPASADSTRPFSHDLIQRLEQWRLSPNVVTAAEAVEAAIVDGFDAEAENAARFLSADKSDATSLVRRQACYLLKRIGKIDSSELSDNAGFESSTRRARTRTRMAPRDPFAWADLARAHAIAHKDEEAEKAMLAALRLAPNNRHILRSASRLFLHLDDPERAHDLLRKNEATPFDPWLMSGEIALSAVANRKPTFFKKGLKFVDESGASPRHISELASAIGTVHLMDGNRRARKLFHTSLVDPTGNSLAQAEWASPQIGKDFVNPDIFDRVKNASEARVFQAYWKRDLEEAVSRCAHWHDEEPFSSRPFQYGSVAANTIEAHETALMMAQEGLKIAPNSPSLLNSQAFALVSLARYDEALRVLMHSINKFDETQIGPLTATAGMLALRLHQYDEGRIRYRKAISTFRRLGQHVTEALAWAYFALEAARADLPDAPSIYEDAAKACKEAPTSVEPEIILGRARRWIAATSHRRQGTPQPS